MEGIVASGVVSASQAGSLVRRIRDEEVKLYDTPLIFRSRPQSPDSAHRRGLFSPPVYSLGSKRWLARRGRTWCAGLTRPVARLVIAVPCHDPADYESRRIHDSNQRDAPPGIVRFDDATELAAARLRSACIHRI